MRRTVALILSVLLLSVAFAGCSGKKAELDPNAGMIGDSIAIAENLNFEVMVVMENIGSDYAKPDKGHVFAIVKIRVDNKSGDTIELKESDFKVTVDANDAFEPISGKLNFVPDKMPEVQPVEADSSITTKLVWMIPKDSSLKVLEYTPSFAQDVIKVNLNEAQ